MTQEQHAAELNESRKPAVLAQIENVGGGLDGARWMRTHYLTRARRQRQDAYERAAWMACARHAHAAVMACVRA